MSNHQKRLSVPKSWPVERKTSTFTVAAGAGPHGKDGVPLLILLRDVLGYVDSRKEARYALSQDAILVNGDPINDESRPIGMFDIVAFPDREEYYRVFPDEGGRLSLTPIDAEAADSRLGKVVGKQQVDGGATQLSLHDGTNLIVEDDGINTTDSIVVDNEEKAIVAHFPFEVGALVTAVQGNHGGKIGELESFTVTPGSGPNTVAVDTADGAFETIEEYLVVIDENFTDDDDADADATASDDEAAAAADTDAGDESAADAGASEEAADAGNTDDADGGDDE